MLINKTKYDADIDRLNVKKYEYIKSTPTTNKNRRLQNFDPDAPISAKHKKKRKNEEEIKQNELLQQEESQNENSFSAGSSHLPKQIYNKCD